VNQLIFKVDNNVTYIEGRIESALYKKFKKKLGYKPEESFWMIKANEDKAKKKKEKWREEWDGYISAICYNSNFCKCFSKKKGMHFHTGLLSRARDFFSENSVSIECVDIREKVQSNNLLTRSSGYEKREYQEESINKIIEKDRGVIRMATGSGKTFVISSVIAERSVFPTVVYVPSIDLLKQTKDEIERFVKQEGKNIEVGMIGGGHKQIKDVNVMTIQTAVRALGGKYVKFDDEEHGKDNTEINDVQKEIQNIIRESRLIFADESHHWSCETCQIISDASKSAKYKYSTSATPYRDKGDDILIEGCFGKIIVDINASRLIREGYLMKPTIYMIPFQVESLGLSNYANIYKAVVVENVKRNKIISALANNYYKEGRNVLVLVKHIAHGKTLEKMIPGSVFIHGSVSNKKRQERIDTMRKPGAKVTVASTILDEGIDCKPLDTLILGGSGKSSSRALQRIGRVLRPHKGKKDVSVIDFYDNVKYLKDHSKKREKMYKTEEEFVIKNDKGF
jgi:superfamily II DNA or RNA helicase